MSELLGLTVFIVFIVILFGVFLIFAWRIDRLFKEEIHCSYEDLGCAHCFPIYDTQEIPDIVAYYNDGVSCDECEHYKQGIVD